MTELEKIAYAKSYIEKLANGVNPLTDQVVSDMDVINNCEGTRNIKATTFNIKLTTLDKS